MEKYPLFAVLLSLLCLTRVYQSNALAIEPIRYTEEMLGELKVTIGRMTVPENRHRESERTIELAFIKLSATTQNPGPPTVFLEGGPGIPASVVYQHIKHRQPFYDELRKLGDVILLDQRGTGLSSPDLTFPKPLVFPATAFKNADNAYQFAEDTHRTIAKHFRDLGVDLNAYNTRESADDVDDLRTGLGVDKINLVGFSYGTHLALVTLRRHAPHINRVVVMGPAGPQHMFKFPSDVQAQLEKIAALSDADPRVNKLVPDFLALMERVLSDADKNPIELEVEDPATGNTIRYSLGRIALEFITIYDFGDTRDFIKFPRLFYRVSKGDYSDLVKFIKKRFLPKRREQAVSSTMRIPGGASPERRRRIDRERSSCLIGDAIDFPFGRRANRDVWELDDLGEQFRSPLVSDTPTLFCNGTFDGNVGSNVAELLDGFSEGVHVVFENAGHEDYMSYHATAPMVAAFLKGNLDFPRRITLPLPRFVAITE